MTLEAAAALIGSLVRLLLHVLLSVCLLGRGVKTVNVHLPRFPKVKKIVDHQLGPVLDEDPAQCPNRTQLTRQKTFWTLQVVVPPEQKIPLVHSVAVLRECSQDKQRLGLQCFIRWKA